MDFINKEVTALKNSSFITIDTKTLHAKCVVCCATAEGQYGNSSRIINSNESSFNYQKPNLSTLCSILRVSNLCETISVGNPNGEDFSRDDKLFCPSCCSRILEAVKVRTDIEDLQKKLNGIISNLKSLIMLSVEGQGKENSPGESDLDKFARTLRYSLYQCWAIAKVQLTAVRMPMKGKPKTRRRRKASQIKLTPSIINVLDTSAIKLEESVKEVEAGFEDDFVDTFAEKSESMQNDTAVPLYNPDVDVDVDQKAAEVTVTADRPEDIVLGKGLENKKKNVERNMSSKKFSRKINLRAQQNKKRQVLNCTPKVPKSSECRFCGKDFSWASASTENNGTKNLKCEVPDCKKKAISFSHLVSHHQRTCPHRSLFPGRKRNPLSYKCDSDNCDKTFETLTAYKHHQLSIHEQKFSYFCEICGHGTQSKSMLIRHMLVHSDEKKLHCDQCDYRCKRPSQLKYHKRIHTNEYPHLCQICGRSFRQNNKLQQHMASHTASKEFPCYLCGKLFASKNYVTNHVHSFHEKRFQRKSASSKKAIKNSFEQPAVPDGSFHESSKREESRHSEEADPQTTTIILHVTDGIVENVSEPKTVLEI